MALIALFQQYMCLTDQLGWVNIGASKPEHQGLAVPLQPASTRAVQVRRLPMHFDIVS